MNKGIFGKKNEQGSAVQVRADTRKAEIIA